MGLIGSTGFGSGISGTLLSGSWQPEPLQQLDPGQQLPAHRQGLQGIQGTQAGHEQQEGGGAGGLLQQLLLPPPLQHDEEHLGAHIHQTLQGEHEHPVHEQGLHVVVDCVVVTVVVVGSGVVVGGAGVFCGGLSLQQPHPLQGGHEHGTHQIILHC